MRIISESGEADAYLRLQLPAQAVPHYQKLISLRPSLLSARHKLGQSLRLSGQVEEATKLYAGLLRINQADTVAHRAMATLLETANDPRAALIHRLALLRLEGGKPEDYETLLARLLAAKMTSDAIGLLESGHERHPDHASLTLRLAELDRLDVERRLALVDAFLTLEYSEALS